MKLAKTAGAIALVTGILVSAASADLVMDFDTFKHGEKMSTQYLSSLGVTISADNVSGGPDLALTFDTNRTGTADPDLQGPNWSRGNLAPSTNLGGILIIAENSKDRNGDGYVDSPDDEGDRPAGSLTFDFNQSINSFGLDLVDIEGPSEFGIDSGFLAVFFQGSTQLARVGFGDFLNPSSPFYDPSVEFGDHSANRISPISAAALGITAFDRVQINMGGSGGIDNVRYTVVPEPASAGLMLLGTMALLMRRRGAKAA